MLCYVMITETETKKDINLNDLESLARVLKLKKVFAYILNYIDKKK